MNELTAMRETATDATVEQVRTASRCILICWQIHHMYMNDILFIAKGIIAIEEQIKKRSTATTHN